MRERIAKPIEQIEALDAVLEPLQKAVQTVVPERSELKDVLSGTWLGEPPDPPLTDVVIGTWTSALLLDLLGGEQTQKAADGLVAAGVRAAVPTRTACSLRLGRTLRRQPPGRRRARARQHDGADAACAFLGGAKAGQQGPRRRPLRAGLRRRGVLRHARRASVLRQGSRREPDGVRGPAATVDRGPRRGWARGRRADPAHRPTVSPCCWCAKKGASTGSSTAARTAAARCTRAS